MNEQAIEKRVHESTLQVHSVFYTIQGEGPFTGSPAVFIRLAGCNLQCPGCDTDYTSKRIAKSAEALTSIADQLFTAQHTYSLRNSLVVITGGEPFRQEIGPLIKCLISLGYYVQVESNGTLPPPDGINFSRMIDSRKGAYLVVSPKTGKINPAAARAACCYKYVISADSVDKNDGLPKKVLDNGTEEMRVARPPDNFKPVYLQPMDAQERHQTQRNLNACILSCMKFNYILQLQVHKLVGLP